MNVLILDHHFAQDIVELQLADDGRHVIRTVSPMYFARVAERFFPRDVWGSDLARYHAAEYAEARTRYRTLAFELLRDLYRVFPFELFVSPSDTFFYIRDVIDACRELGVPFVVVQKETGVSATSLAKHAGEMRRWFPFKGDWMTTCCEKSKVFWVAAGAEPEQVAVAGQPRFDYYRHPERWPRRAAGGGTAFSSCATTSTPTTRSGGSALRTGLGRRCIARPRQFSATSLRKGGWRCS